MQKLRTCFFIAVFLCLSQQAAVAEEELAPHQPPIAEVNSSAPPAEYTETEEASASSISKDILSELIIRPVAVLGSATGLALFVIASPISGLASIPEPHDAFKTTWDDFVVTPYHFAFRRPLGDYSVELN